MSSLTDVWKQWEGRVFAGKFPLRQWLGGSEHSAVFLTERTESGSPKAAIKLISVDVFSTDNLDEGAQLSRWAESAKLSQPHLIRLFESGRGKIDDRNFLYVVMEYAEENLAQILPQRPLSPEEVKEMLPPTAETLSFLHQSGLVHGHLKPANIMAVDNQLKISADSLRKAGEPDKQAPSAYLAPEQASTGPSPAADVWSLGMVLVATLTQQEPQTINTKDGWAKIPYFPQPFYETAQLCLRFDPRERCTVNEILAKPKVKVKEKLPAKATEEPLPAKRSTRWFILPVVVAVLLLAVLLARKSHQALPSPSENHATESSSAPVTQSSVPPDDEATPARTGITHGRVLQEISPNVSPGARRTITGHIKVSVRVSVDSSGNVSDVTLTSPGPSKYFANQALAAAGQWKFSPGHVNGRPSASEWILRFQFGRTSTQVSPTETKP
jgi:TonB family protein